MVEVEAGTTLSSVISSLREHFAFNSETWFRGQPRYNHNLLPSIFRQGAGCDCSYDESEMYREFLRRHPDHNSSHKNWLDWLTLMQHFRLPTRLLDWTSNLLVALYFACLGSKDKDEDDAAVFAFSPGKLGAYSLSKLDEIQVVAQDRIEFYRLLLNETGGTINDDATVGGKSVAEIKNDPCLQAKLVELQRLAEITVREPIVAANCVGGSEIVTVNTVRTGAFSNIYPIRHAHLNERARCQHAYFTLHGGKYYAGSQFIEVKAMEKHPDLEGMVKLRIRADAKGPMLHELGVSGIREATLFPEMEYQARDIKRLYTSKLPKA